MQDAEFDDDPYHVDISIRRENFDRAQEIFRELYEKGLLPDYEFIREFDGGLDNKAFDVRVTDIDSPYEDFRQAEMDIYGYTGVTIFRDAGKTLGGALQTLGHEYYHLEKRNQELWKSGDSVR